jgi:polyisoprenoid-binding protein YceI
MKKVACAVGIVGALTSSTVFAWGKEGDAKASFKATGPAGLKIVGEASALNVKDDGKTISLTVPLKDIDTGMSLRNGHMREDLEANKFPDIVLTVPADSLKGFEDGKSFDGESKGTIALHGKTKEVPFKYKVACKAAVCTVDGSADINLADYGVKVRSYLGITVKPEVAIGAQFKLKK